MLKLSPQQIQLMKLIQMPLAQLEERIKDEIEENPALEIIDENDEADAELKDEFADNSENESEEADSDYDDLNLSDYINEDDEIPDYKTKDENYPEFDDHRVTPQKLETSFNELMMQQLGMLALDDEQHRIAEQIVGSLDDDGYLRREVSSIIDDLAFRQNIDATEKELLEIISMIQQFEPAGIGARDLRECLMLQLERKESDDSLIRLAKKIIKLHFDEFIKKHYEKIQKSLSLSDEELKAVIQVIVKLNPKPGEVGSSGTSGELYIVPDFVVINNNGKPELTLNSRNMPELRISDDYRSMLKDYEKTAKTDKRQKEAAIFIKQKIDSAKWFMDAIRQRQDTLYRSMHAILMHQQSFFISGDETDLKPMILKDIAEKTQLDISTISRVANSKFVQTEFGTFKLKFFFSESIQTESGEEVSNREVKKILSDIIVQEDKKNPLSDETLTDMLVEKGYNIARRTVAKYREQLNIPVARLRKNI